MYEKSRIYFARLRAVDRILCDTKDSRYKITTSDLETDTCPDGFLVETANGEPIYDYKSAVVYDFEITPETKIELIRYINDEYATIFVSRKEFSNYIADPDNTDYYYTQIYSAEIKNGKLFSLRAEYQ